MSRGRANVANICNCVNNVEIVVKRYNERLTWECRGAKWRAEESAKTMRTAETFHRDTVRDPVIIRETLFKETRIRFDAR